MTKKRVLGLVKLLVFAALIYFVARGVQWRDMLVRTSADKEQRITTPGKIEGRWELDDVAFRRRNETTGDLGPLEIVQRGKQPDGSTIDVLAGFTTYLRTVYASASGLLLFALGALCYCVTLVLSGVRWWWLLRVNKLSVSLWEAQRFTWIGLFFSNVVPGSTGGDLIKALYIMKHCPGARVQALVSVIVDRVIGLGSLALLAAIVVLFALDRFGDLALAIWAVLLGVTLIGVIAFSRRLRELLRIKALLNRLPAKISAQLKRVDQAVFYYRAHTRGIVVITVAGMVIHVLACLSVLLMGQAMQVGVLAQDYFVIIPIVNIVSAVPIAPNGWGWGEATYGVLFGTYCGYAGAGIATRGVALSLLYRLHVTLWSLLGGLAALLEKNKVTRADLQHEQELERGEDAAAVEQ